MEVRLFATFREGRGSVVDVQWREGMDGYALFALLGIPAEKVAIYLVNGMRMPPDVILSPDDVIALFPPVGGG